MIRVVAGYDEPAWSGLAGATALQHPAWLRVMAGRLPGQVCTVTDDDRIGFVGAVVSDPDAYEAYNPRALLWRNPPVFPVAAAARRATWLLANQQPALLPALVLVAPGYLGDPVGRCRQDTGALQQVLRELVRWCQSQGVASLHVLYTQRATAAVAAAVGQLGGVSFPLTQRWQLPVWWDGWESYLAGFSSKRSRRIRHELRTAAAAGIEPGPVDIDRGFDRVIEGRCELLRHYRQPVDEAAERQRLGGLAEAFGPALRIYGALRDGDPVAASVCVRNDRSVSVVYASTTGLARDRYPGAHFLATYYAIVADLSRREVDAIDYGIGHPTSKSLRGCRPQQLHGHSLAARVDLAAALRASGRMLAECTDAPLPTDDHS